MNHSASLTLRAAGLAAALLLAGHAPLFGAVTMVQESAANSGGAPPASTPGMTVQPLEAFPAELRGDLLMVRGRYQAALDAYHLVAHPSAGLWNKIGIAYQHLRALDLAQVNYLRALRMDRNNADVLNNLGTICYAKKDFHKAEKLYREAMKRSPRSAIIPRNLGTAYFAETKVKQGAEAYRAAFALDPQFGGSDPVQSVPESASLLERASRDYCLAQLFAEAGMKERAIEYLRRALDEGFSDRKRVMQDQQFAGLRGTAAFAELMADQKQR